MTISLKIDNVDALPDGGPLSYRASGRGFEIGREHRDWTLPDPNMFISGRHCEVRYEKDGYWLYDVSRNGTFVNGASQRVRSPHLLAHGDSLKIGHYVITVSLEEDGAAAGADSPFAARPGNPDNIWDVGGPVPPPINRRDLMAPQQRGQRGADFAERHMELPPAFAGNDFPDFSPPPERHTPAPAPSGPQAQPSWEMPSSAPSVRPPEPQRPEPRRPEAERPDPLPEQAAQESPFGAAGQTPHIPRPVPAPQPAPRAPVPFDFGGESFAPPSYPEAAQPAPRATPQPPRPATPHPVPAGASAGGQAGAEAVLRGIAAGAGVSPNVFLQRDQADVAAEIGAVLRIVVEEMAILLKARAAAKLMAKSGNRTMISAVDNNPLKFVPRPEEVLEIMFARRAGYLDASRSVGEAFQDLKAHEFATYAAMQKALARLLEDLSPEAIEAKVPSSAFSSKKSRAWETFVATWEAKEKPHENGMLDVFLAYFSDAYAKANKPK